VTVFFRVGATNFRVKATSILYLITTIIIFLHVSSIYIPSLLARGPGNERKRVGLDGEIS